MRFATREVGPQSTQHISASISTSTNKTLAEQTSLDTSIEKIEAKGHVTTEKGSRKVGVGNTADPLEIDQESPVSSLSTIPKDEHNYPEGGLRAWLVVLGSWCGFIASLGIANTMGSFQAYISENQLASYSTGQIGWIFSLYAFLTFACGIYIGPLFDVYGPRWLVLPGSASVCATMFLLGVCESESSSPIHPYYTNQIPTEYWHFILVFGILGGVGTSLLFTPCVAAIGHFFHRRRGNATGIAATGGALGGIIFPLMLQKTIPSIGFAWSTRIMGFIFLFLCLLANLLIRSRLPPAKKSFPKPDFHILANPAFALTVLGVFLLEWALFIPLTYITSYALQQGFPQAFSYQILPILNNGSVFGRWLPGYYADHIGRYNTAILSILLTIISCLCIWLPAGSSTAGLVIFALLFGFASGSNISLTPVCVGQLCDTKDYGRYYATCYTIVSIGCLTGIPIAGEILQRDGGGYAGFIVFTGACYVGGLVAFGAARVLGVGWRIGVKY
jgi:MFS family permease